MRAEPKLTHAHTSRGRGGYPERIKKCATAGEQLTRTNPPSTVSPLAVRVNLNSDEATSTAIPLAGVSRNSRTSRLYQYCLLARNQNSRMPTHFARGRRGYPRQCLAQHAGLRVNNELGLRPQYSLPSSSVLDCGLTLTRTVLEAAHHCPRSTTRLPSSSVLDCGLTCPPLPAFDNESSL